MKIMYLLFSFTIGGTERLVADMCNEMVELEQEIHLYIVNNLISDELLKTLDDRVHVYTQKRECGSGNKLSVLWNLAQYIKNEKIELIHCNSFNAPELLLLSKIISPKIKVVHTIHGMGQYKTLSKLRVFFRNRLCDAFIGISETVKNDIIYEGADPQKTVMIYNGIQIRKYECAKYKLFDKSNIKIGCVARIMPKVKGQDVLLNAVPMLVKRYKDIKVEFAGGIAAEEVAEYMKMQNYVQDNYIGENVQFLGNVEDIPKFLNTIDILVVPSRSEGFGLALLEGMSMGVPCIVSNVDGPAELVKNEKIGVLFPSEDAVALSECIIQVVENYEIYKNIAWRRRKELTDKYSIGTMCAHLLQLYTEI